MESAEKIRQHNIANANAIFEKFESVEDTTLTKSEGETGKVFTEGDIEKFKTDLFKSIDDGSMTPESLEKAQDDLLGLKKETRKVEGKDVTVFVKG